MLIAHGTPGAAADRHQDRFLIGLVGAVLAMTVHPYFAGLSAFVGAGLMFAGITDTCGMAMLLARMPWNQVSAEPVGGACKT